MKARNPQTFSIGAIALHHMMKIWEDHPTDPNLKIKVYATVDVVMIGSDWLWQQVSNRGSLGLPSSPFPTEDDAKADALTALKGWVWI